MTPKKNNVGFLTLALTEIHESTTNPRRTFDESKLAELAESLRTQGLIQPVTVRPNGEGYEIVAGAPALPCSPPCGDDRNTRPRRATLRRTGP